jgi:uncharacterized protein (TIGR03067 family)
MLRYFHAISGGLFCILLASCAVAPKSPTLTDLNGIWRITSAEFAGQDLPVQAGFELQISGAQYRVASVSNAAMPSDSGKVELIVGRPVNGVMALDVIGEDGPNQGKRFPAIYRFIDGSDGRALEMCYDLAEKDRPTAFVSPKGTLLLRVSYAKK